MDLEFLIPLRKEDLLKSDKQCYSVDLIPFSDAVNQVRDLKFSIEKNGCEFILKNFDLCFSFLFESEDSSISQMQEFYDDVVEELMKRLCPYVEDSLGLNPQDKNRALNVVKMVCYLFSLFLKSYEDKEVNKTDNMLVKKPRLKSGKKKFEENWPWFDKKLDGFSVLFSLLQHPLGNLWQNRAVEDPFVNLIAGCCFKALENSEINQIKCKPLRDSVSQVLSSLIVNYNYTLTFLPKAVESMKQFEHIASSIAHIVFILIDEYFSVTILDKMLNELLDVCLEDPQAIGKSVAVFITDLGENHPHLFTSSVDILKDFLCVDAYPVRNAVLITFCEMIIHCYSEDKITEEVMPSRNSILRVLQDHLTDENAYVRSKVVHLWTKLASSKNIPVSKYSALLRDMSKRLKDKSIYVSKNSINFFTTALQNNPYGGKLRLIEVNKEKESEMKKLKELQSKQPISPEERWNEIGVVYAVSEYFKQDVHVNGSDELQDNNEVDISVVLFIIANLINKNLYLDALKCLISSEKVFPDSQEIRCNIDCNDQVAYYVATLKKIYLRAAELDPEAIVPDYFDNLSKVESAKKVVTFLVECSDFIDSINKASDTIYKLMFSKNNSEILEAIEFFSTAYKFKVENSDKAVRDMLLLVNSNTVELKDAVAKAYGCLYLESTKPTSKARAVQIAHRLINLVKSIDSDQKLALEELLKTWVSSGQLDKEFILALLERIVQPSHSTTEKSDIVSIDQFSSDCNAALILLEIIAETDKNNSIVLGNLNHLKTLLNCNSNNYTIKLVCSLIKSLGTTKQNNKPLRYRKENEIFQTAVSILIDKYNCSVGPEFTNMAMSIIDLIFQFCYKPEDLGNEILYKMNEKLMALGKKIEDQDIVKYDVFEDMLEKLFFVCGHIVFRKWQYCDMDVFNWLKKCHNGVVAEKRADESLDEYEMEADNVVAADEALYEKLTSICTHFLSEDDLIQHISDLVIIVCQCPDDKVSPSLKASASLALAKFMFVSSDFSEKQFQLYMTLMDRCKHDTVRSNLILGFGDLLCRFPNTAEPWTPFLYSRLRDHSESVRLNTVSVLCQLISREMIKVRGQFAELLIHLEDMNSIIVEKVNSLLLDLSRKGNTIYNVIPDIISKLSNPEREDPVSSSTFKLVIGRLFELVTKERQSDLLVEKLCARLCESTNERQWEDISYCLSQIRFTEKSIRKLTEALPTFTERLLHPPVQEIIHNIISSCAKSTKSTLKELAHEASDKLEELLTSKDGDETISTRHQNTQNKKDENSSSNSDSSPKKTQSDDEDNINEDKEMKTPARPPPRTTRRTASKVPRTPRNKVDKPSDTQPVTRSTRKKKATKYVSSDED